VPTPSGVPFTQATAQAYAAQPWLAFACGRYEGIDHRVVQYASSRMRVEEISIGDYVLGGGEAAVLVIVEAVTRLLPGVLGNAESLVEESHVAGLLEGPAYTKPASWRGLSVPEALLSGDHARIARWRRVQSLQRTVLHRPDLFAALPDDALSESDMVVINEAARMATRNATEEDSIRSTDRPVAD
jgi:tRNA (guanine37-N1)-methyltransferase